VVYPTKWCPPGIRAPVRQDALPPPTPLRINPSLPPLRIRSKQHTSFTRVRINPPGNRPLPIHLKVPRPRKHHPIRRIALDRIRRRRSRHIRIRGLHRRRRLRRRPLHRRRGRRTLRRQRSRTRPTHRHRPIRRHRIAARQRRLLVLSVPHNPSKDEQHNHDEDHHISYHSSLVCRRPRQSLPNRRNSNGDTTRPASQVVQIQTDLTMP
jgi:hypothetical protein